MVGEKSRKDSRGVCDGVGVVRRRRRGGSHLQIWGAWQVPSVIDFRSRTDRERFSWWDASYEERIGLVGLSDSVRVLQSCGGD